MNGIPLTLFLSAFWLVQAPQGSMEGTVTRLGSGQQPVTHARVSVSLRPGQPGARGAAGPPATQTAFTDGKGKFVVTGLNDGVYNVQFQANGYVGQRYGRLTTGNGTPVTVTAGQATKDINVALTPAGNIAGHIRDTSDQPLIKVPVELLRASYDSYGRRVYASVASTQTNDRGEYRMYWVTPGRYYLRAGNYSGGGSPRDFSFLLGGESGANGSDIPRVAGYAFYPAATELGNARAIDVPPGADLRTIDVTVITRSRTFSIRGKVTDSRTGKPPLTANVFAEDQGVGLGPVTGGTDLPSPAYNAATGTFEIRNLLPGTYSVVGILETPRPPGPPGLPEPPAKEASGSTTVTVTDSDVNDVALAVTPGATVVGRFRVEGELPAQALAGRPLVWLLKIGGSGGFEETLQPAFLDPAGNFQVDNVSPGEYLFDFGNFDIHTIGFVREARLDGGDALSVPLRISGSTHKQFDLVVRAGGGQLTGTVNDLQSQPVPGARVVLVPDRARFRVDLYRTAFTGQAGRFTFPRVAPGDYRVFSWESIEQNAWLDPEVLARLEPRGVRVHVTETSTETINVQVIPGEGR